MYGRCGDVGRKGAGAKKGGGGAGGMLRAPEALERIRLSTYWFQ